jgi:lysophospholipase
VNDAPASGPGGLEVRWAEVDGLDLRLAVAPPLAGGRSLLLLPGRTEFLEKYEDVLAELRGRGFRVASLDWRGQGASSRLLADPKRGHVDDFRAFQRDLDALLRAVAGELPRPWTALAHSMGGLILIERLMADPRLVERAILSSPLFDVRMGPLTRAVAPHLAAAACRLGLAGRYAPGQGPAPLAGDEPVGNVLTSDHARFRRYRERCRANPEKMLGGVTWGWLHAAFAAIRRVSRPGALEAVTTPVLMFEAGHERVVEPEAIARAAARLPSARRLRLPGAEHEVMMERQDVRARVFAAVDAFAA